MYFFLYQSDINNKWYWRLKGDNSKIIADGAEGCINKQDAIRGINLIKQNAANLDIYDSSTSKLL